MAWRKTDDGPEVLLVHPGGPFWKNKDHGSWSIPKGEIGGQEDALQAAKREFQEETGIAVSGDFVALLPVKLKSGKVVHGFAVKFDADLSRFRSNEFTMEWPPRSGKMAPFPEVDRAEYFTISMALIKINTGQAALLDQLQDLLDREAPIGTQNPPGK